MLLAIKTARSRRRVDDGRALEAQGHPEVKLNQLVCLLEIGLLVVGVWCRAVLLRGARRWGNGQ